MTTRTTCRGIAAGSLLSLLLLSACTGGSETTAAEEDRPKKNGITTTAPEPAQAVDARQSLESISSAIPVYAGARYRDDLTKRDAVMAKTQYGADAQVYTLATDDSYPQVYHYYLTYLAQFRAFPAQVPYPPSQQNWRTYEVQLNQAMQDPFIPGEAMPQNGKQVLLQIAETEAEPKTVIRYIVTPAATTPPVATASAPADTRAVAR